MQEHDVAEECTKGEAKPSGAAAEDRELFEDGANLSPYELCGMGNIDQSDIFYTNERGRMLETMGKRNIWMLDYLLQGFKCSKVLCISADGRSRAKLMIIFRWNLDVTPEVREAEQRHYSDEVRVK